MRFVKILAIAVPVLLVAALGAGFLSLGANAVPPAQTLVHRDLPAGTFAPPAAPSLASVMPEPAAATPGAAAPGVAPRTVPAAVAAPVPAPAAKPAAH